MGGRGSGARAVDFTSAKGIDLWDRQPKETDKAWVAFIVYRDMGVERAIRKVPENLGRKPRYHAVLEQWSARWGWGVRTAAWDAYGDRRKREAVLKASEKKAVEKLAVADALWKTAAIGLGMWAKYLQYTNEQQTKAGIPEQPPISAGDINRLAEAGLKLSQVLEGKPSDIQEQRHALTIDQRRQGIADFIHNPMMREAMRLVHEAKKGGSLVVDASPEQLVAKAKTKANGNSNGNANGRSKGVR